MTPLETQYQEKGLAVTQIELWQHRLKVANESIIKLMNEQDKPKLVETVDAEPVGSAG